jgi:hypothetical protein
MNILRCRDLRPGLLTELLRPFGLDVDWVADNRPIPGTFWGDSEAGLIGNRLYVRGDTPVHSALHESCHWLCMPAERRQALHTDAGGDDLEECGVCYLQVLLADRLPGMGQDRLFADMDAWGYNFRLGSARRWFYADAEDAREWLVERGIIDTDDRVLRGTRQARRAG